MANPIVEALMMKQMEHQGGSPWSQTEAEYPKFSGYVNKVASGDMAKEGLTDLATTLNQAQTDPSVLEGYLGGGGIGAVKNMARHGSLPIYEGLKNIPVPAQAKKAAMDAQLNELLGLSAQAGLSADDLMKILGTGAIAGGVANEYGK